MDAPATPWRCRKCEIILGWVVDGEGGKRLIFDDRTCPARIERYETRIRVVCPRCGAVRDWCRNEERQ
jgi:hypothetical protein